MIWDSHLKNFFHQEVVQSMIFAPEWLDYSKKRNQCVTALRKKAVAAIIWKKDQNQFRKNSMFVRNIWSKSPKKHMAGKLKIYGKINWRQLKKQLLITVSHLSIFSMEYYNNNRQRSNSQKMMQNLYKSKSSSLAWQQKNTFSTLDLTHIQSSYHRKSNTKEEEAQEKNKKLQLTTIDLFFWKAQKKNQEIQSTFQLINLDQTYTPPAQVTLEHLQNLNFPVLKYQVRDLIDFGIKILRTTQFCNLNFTERVTKKLVTLLAKNYNAVAYHNFSHAFYFTMLVYQCFTREYSLKHICNDEELFYILAAGLCHDLNHNGSTNSFEIKIKSQLAEQVKNQSVLENMHLRHLWKIMEENPDLNFISPAKDKVKAKQIITRLILSTDMAFHSKNLENFRNVRKASNFDMKRNVEHKWVAIQQVFHACDIGNPCTDYSNYISWGALLSHEFNEVARQQKRLNLEVTKCLEITSTESVYKDQVWFIGFLVQPIWRQLGDLFPSFSVMNANIQKNLKRVKAQLQKLKN